MALSDILRERGYVYQHSSATLEEITDGAKRTLYLGVDPTADSAHIGHLSGLLVLRRFLEDGHKVIILTGGGTGMIGDPGGKSEERNLLDEATIAKNTAAVAAQIRKVFGSGDFIEENNASWLTKLNLIEFLRDIGKHFTVNSMIKKDIVKDRLDAESPISYTEFSYSLLQAYDFYHLNQEHGCDLQIGGSDQWSNIIAGVDFIRRKTEKEAYALTFPLIVDASTGKKFGKSEGGAVWLDPEKTTPFYFYQFFLNVGDNMVEELFLKLTLVPTDEIQKIIASHQENPGARLAQKTLARAVTALVHGDEVASVMGAVSEVLFGDQREIDQKVKDALMSAAPNYKVAPAQNIVDILIASGLATSKREARDYVEQGAVTLNGAAITDVQYVFQNTDVRDGFALLKRGKRNVCVLTLV